MRLRPRRVLAPLFTVVLLAAGPLAAPAQAQQTGSAGAAPAATQGETVSCEVAYRVLNDWGSGFQAQVTVTNTGTVPVFWEVEIVFPDTEVVQVWNVMVTQSGDSFWFEPPPWWNGTYGPLLPGESVSFGFLATGERQPESIEVTCWPA